jgi:phenylpropionate dioxygenase-like ring-hydroxylating dioxygenase large terminal subunit
MGHTELQNEQVMAALRVGAGAAEPAAVVIDGQRSVVWTGADGSVRVALDQCPHRRAPLSKGTVVDGELRCPYHGWRFDGTGACTFIPALGPDGHIPPKARLAMQPVSDGCPDTRLSTAVVERDADHSRRPPVAVFVDGDTKALGAFWHPVARRDELPPEGETIDVELLEERWTIRCGDHGRWSARSTTGRSAWGVDLRLDHLWLAPREPIAPLPTVPEWGEDGWHHRRMQRVEGRFGVGLLLDNQLDAAHFPFLHGSTFGNSAGEQIPPYTTSSTRTGVSASIRIPITAKNDPLAVAGAHDLQQHRTMHYEFQAPLWLRLRLDYEDMGGSTVILFSLTPQRASRARMDIDLLFRHPGGLTDTQLDERVAFEERVVAEDVRLQGHFEDLRLPLDPTVEAHISADRLSVECRRVLRSLLSAYDST